MEYITLINNRNYFVEPLRNESKIFFLETSLTSKNGIVSLGPREACSIESAALNNPNATIYLLIFSECYQKFGLFIYSFGLNFLFNFNFLQIPNYHHKPFKSY